MTVAAKSYFRYHLRSKWKLLICLTAIALVLTLLFASGQKDSWTYYDDNFMNEITRVNYEWTVGNSVFILIVCSAILPVTEFSIFKKRRNLDCIYGLPVTRKELGIIHYITGLICLFVPFTLAYLLNSLLMLRYPEGFVFSPLIGYYFVSILLAWCAYSLNVFAFNQANTTGDGIWFMILWNLLAWTILTVVNEVSPSIFGEREIQYGGYIGVEPVFEIPNIDMSIYWGAQLEIQAIYENVVEKFDDTTLWEFWGDPAYVSWLIPWAVIGIASVLVFFFSFGKRRTEKTEEVSDSWFGFKVLIPLYAITLLIGSGGAAIIVVLILAFVGYLIYRRGFHLKLSDWLVLGGTLPTGVLMMIIMVLIERCYK